MDHDLLVLGAQRGGYRCRLDELWAVADDRQDLQPFASSPWIRAEASRASRAVTGPSGEKLCPSTAKIGWTSRVVEVRKASSASNRSSSVHGCSCAPLKSITSARVIDARMCSESGGVKMSGPLTQKIELVGASSTRPCGVTRSASSAPRSRASRLASMFPP